MERYYNIINPFPFFIVVFWGIISYLSGTLMAEHIELKLTFIIKLQQHLNVILFPDLRNHISVIVTDINGGQNHENKNRILVFHNFFIMCTHAALKQGK